MNPTLWQTKNRGNLIHTTEDGRSQSKLRAQELNPAATVKESLTVQIESAAIEKNGSATP